MHRHLRPAATLAVVLALLGAAPAGAQTDDAQPVSGAPAAHVDQLQLAAGTGRIAEQQALAFSAAPAPCNDTAYQLSGGRWTRTLKWSFRASSTPAGLSRSSALSVIKRSFGNITGARNDCGRSDRVGASASYLGTTSSKARCNAMDGRNVVGFKSLPGDVLARTCWWVISGRIVEADIQINSNYSWATSLSSCRGQPMLEAVMTHEVGHAFGMGHVGEGRHGRLTMSRYLDGLCNNQEATLGAGDMLGLEKLY
jgi:hypothetical protein